ncbi:MAG TPA: RhuM family protein [Chitinophagaceae bacterium]|nr:RhuM family protein [Chitinophagaceae bacterium]
MQKHLSNIFKTKELNAGQTCAKFTQVQKEGNKTVRRDILHYNLDAIISVGYRVNSKRGTQFRQWATQRLKEHLVKGYTINEKRLADLEQTIKLVRHTGQVKELSATEAKGLLEIIANQIWSKATK